MAAAQSIQKLKEVIDLIPVTSIADLRGVRPWYLVCFSWDARPVARFVLVCYESSLSPTAAGLSSLYSGSVTSDISVLLKVRIVLFEG